MTQNESFEYLRACTLLALTSIQWGHIGSMQQYMGLYFTLAAMQRFYDEQYWSSSLSAKELEVRRRNWWCAYTLDVYAATIWSCFLRTQECHCNVKYPGDIYGKQNLERNPESSWLTGWNFATDLYRVLEHVLSKARSQKSRHGDRRRVDHLVFQEQIPDSHVMQTILELYYALPAIFKETPPMTGDMRKDIYAYQAANIQATLQLVRMIIFSMNDGASTEAKCDVITEVLSVFHTIPREYLRAISTPLIYHLGHIGQILASVIDEATTESRYFRIRTSLLSMADLLSSLEEGLVRAAGASQSLRDQVNKLDQNMRTRRRLPQPSLISSHQAQETMSQQSVYGFPQYNYLADPTADFQLPPELFGDWTWPADFAAQPNLFPGGYQ